MEIDKIINGDCITGMRDIPDGSMDCILTDPPYLYLKNQRLDRPFDEVAFFNEVKRVLKKGGFIVMFGRGTSFYRWNTMLADLGFNFKEEIIWNKGYCTSPLMALSRVHETISICCNGKGSINRVKVPYLEMKKYDVPAIYQDIKRMSGILKNPKSLHAVLNFLKRNDVYDKNDIAKINELTISGGKILKPDRCAAVMQAVRDGFNEKSVINERPDHYTAIHPTQKPVRLLERLLALVTKEGDTVLDPFSGSGSTAIACMNTGRHYLGYEIDKEYFVNSINRLNNYGKANRSL